MRNARRQGFTDFLSWIAVALCLWAAPASQAVTLDITSQFSITRSGFVLNRTSNTYDATVKLTNVSGAPVLAPISIVVAGLPNGVTLANKAGDTSDGRPYVSPLSAGTQLQNGATQSFVLKFANPARVTITYFLQVLYSVEVPADAPSLLGVLATGGTNAYLIGRVDGAASQQIALQAAASATCVSGTLVSGAAVGGTLLATTDAQGYFRVGVAGVNPGAFVTIKLTSPRASPSSLCQVSSRDNDSWPKAFRLDGSTITVRDYIDAPGRARWYKLAVAPGQRLQVVLSELPADYDVAVFKDIGKAFASQFDPATANTNDLVRLAAETAPSTFSPSTFSSVQYNPSTFSPDALAPSTFSPSTFSADVFASATLSPSTFSPSTFSSAQLLPSTFSPSTFSPQNFGPSTFSPSIYTDAEIAKAFSTAQTRSIVAFSPVAGNGSESLVVNTWNNTGDYYVRVTGRAGAFNTSRPFAVSVTKGATTCTGVTDTSVTVRPSKVATGLKTVILADSSRIAFDDPLPIPGGGTLREKLAVFANRAEVRGVVVDVAGDARVTALKTQAADNPACPFAKNLVAEEIKGIVDSYRTNPLQYVVIVGNDDSIPFFRSPDLAELGQESSFVPPVQSNSPSEASLRKDFVLSQDAYGSKTKLFLPWSDFPVPGLAVGRLIETPAEIAGIVDAYVAANGVVVPKTSLVTGYDFLEDAANAVRTELQLGTGATVDALITPNGKAPGDPASWTAAQLGQKLLGSRHDLVFLAGHFSANSALAADFATSLLTTDLAASAVDMTNSIVFSAGCHSGYNLVDAHAIPGVTMPLDWAQAFARKRATLIGGTAYQYGDTDFLEYSERLYRNFARNLRAGTGAIAIGEALVRAKVDYLATTAPDIRGLHEKALLQATLFGLPMLGVNMPAGRGDVPGGTPVIDAQDVPSGPAATLGLRFHNLSVSPSLTPRTQALKNLLGGPDVVASWLDGPDGIVTQPGEPALPLAAVNVTPTDPGIVLRGIGFRGGSFVDTAPVVPFTGAPTTEIRGVHAQFVTPVFYPARMWSPNYFGALAGNGGTQLLVTPAQHRVANLVDGTSTQRKFTNLDLRLYYSGELGPAALSDAPSIVGIDEVRNGSDVLFTAEVVGNPAAAIHQVWVTYTNDGGSAWTSLDLVQCVAPLPAACGTTEDSRLWKGRLVGAPSGLRYIVQAVNGIGLVAVDDNLGSYYGVGAVTPAATTVELVAPPASASVGDTINVTVKLAFGGLGIAGKTVSVAIGGSTKFGTTAADGSVTVAMPVAAVPGNYPVTASFIGDENLLASSTTASFQLNRATPTLAGLSPAGVTLTGTLGGKTQALQQEAVSFQVSGPSGPATVWVITDHLGRAPLPPPGLPAGDYTVTSASFGGNATYAASTFSFPTAQQFNVARIAQNIAFAPIANAAYGALLTADATASSGLPVSLAVSGPCSIAGNWIQTTGIGTCTVTASQGGDAVYAAAALQQRSFTIARAGQAITFGPAPSGVTVGQPLVTVAATSASLTSAPSTLPITFGSLTDTVCTVGGINTGFVTPLAQGTCTITADQAGDGGYDAAPRATLTFEVGAAGTLPATFTVTKLADTNDGACNADCSLREAILASNAAAGPNVVNFAPGLTGTITLTLGQIQIAGPLIVDGPGAGVLTISGNFNNRIFGVFATSPACPAPGAPVTLDGPDYLVSISGLRLVNGRRNVANSSGGAIYSEHSLLLDSVDVEGSAARSGGAVMFSIQYPGQTLSIFDSRFLNNTATDVVASTDPYSNAGGAIYVVQKCQNATDNPYTKPVAVTIVGSEFLGNRVRPLSARDGRGGALRSWSLADFYIADTIFTDNHVEAPNPPFAGFAYYGGAIEGTAKSWRIESSELSGNSAYDVTASDATRAGAFRPNNPSIDRQGPGDRVAVKIVNSTISGNLVSASVGAILASGNVALELINSTVSDNVADPSRAGGIALSIGTTYPVSATNASRPTLTLVSSIVANNSSLGGDVAVATSQMPTFTVNAFNSLIEKLCPAPNCGMFVSGSGNLVGIDPLLGPLQDNGGLSRTHALLPGSPAINAGSNPLGLLFDQRGDPFLRDANGAPDMGAYEYVTP